MFEGKKKKLAFWGWTGFLAWKLTANSYQQLPSFYNVLVNTINYDNGNTEWFPV